MSRDDIVFSLLAAGAGVFVVFRAIPSYLRQRKQKLEAERKRAEERAKQAEAERQERDRKQVLRERDPEVDPIIRSLILAKLHLQRLLSRIDGFDISLTPEKVVQLQKWAHDHQGVMDFHVFRAIKEYFPQPDEEDPVLLKDEIQGILDDLHEPSEYLEYADEKLGIAPRYYLWDGQNCGGVKYERADGRDEDVTERYERVLRKLPGTDRGCVYVLTNSSLPELVKIGKTHRDPKARAAELSDLSGVPTPFTVAYETIVSNCGLVETTVHERLSGHRVADNREFFSITVRQAAELIEQVAREIDEGAP
jgi:hypothetical protein